MPADDSGLVIACMHGDRAGSGGQPKIAMASRPARLRTASGDDRTIHNGPLGPSTSH